MKIKEFSIMHYGPLPNAGRISLHNFNLLFGKNEDGKTLTIDALVKLLLGRNIRDFEYIDRVDEDPEGYVIIEDNIGKEVKLPEKGDLTKITGLSSAECRNIFIIRNSELSITHESEFYTNVTDQLIGLRTEDISKIKNALREIGKITPGGILRDVKDEKLRTKIENARGLIKEIESIEKEIKQKKFEELELELVKEREKIEEIEQKIESLEDARKRGEYEEGKKALDKLKKSLESLRDLEVYNENDAQLWRDCEKNIQTYDGENKRLHDNLKKKEKKLEEISKELSRIEREFRAFDERKKKLDDEIKPELKNYEKKREKLVLQEGESKFFALLGMISAILFGISLLGIILNPSLLFYILAVSFLILCIVSGIFKFQFTRNKVQLTRAFERINLALSKFELNAKNVEGIFSNIQKFDEEYHKRNDELQDVKLEKKNLEGEIKDLRNNRILNIENKIKEAKEKISKIKTRSKEDSLKEYTKKLKVKQKFERLKEQQKSVLKSHFGGKGKSLEENISYWEEEIRKLEGYKDKAKDIKYSETTKLELKEDEQKLEEKLKGINKKMESIQREMEEVERKVNEIIREDEHLYCKTSADLEAVKDKLQEFIDKNESIRDNVLEVIKIFEEIEVEEKEKVSDLFGEKSSVSEYFKEITDGLYEEVIFNQKTGKIEVKRKDKIILGAEKLSGGAYDQLYFSIRLALGEKLLKDKKGFFIMDDPFIKADPDRLQRQIKTLKKISKLGWQILYFSAKKEIRETLEEDIKKNNINFVKVKSIKSIFS